MSERAARGWSLAGRLTRLYLLSTCAFVLAIALTSAVFLSRSVHQGIGQLAREEIDELQARFTQPEPLDEAAFREFVHEVALDHPENRMGWRVWPADGGPAWEAGHTRILDAERPARATLGRLEELGGLRWISTRLADGAVVGLVLDGSPQVRLLQKYELIAAIVVGVCLLGSLAIARMVFQRVSSLLHQVASQARSVRGVDQPLELAVEGAPREIREVTDALQELLGRIRRESEEARVFTAGLAHELRSPVQNLIGETEVALLSRREAGAYAEILRSNLDELRRLGDAIDNLVTICSRGRDRRAGVREEFDLAEEAELRIARERAAAERAGVELDFGVRGDTRLSGDREAILRALRNLVQNAIQWSPPGGTVEVRIDGAEREVCATVDDGGPGVPPDLRARIFEPFFRGPSAQGRRVGYGLGLALVQGAANDHGGSVEVGVSPLGGARFRLRLPRVLRTGADGDAAPAELPLARVT